MLRKGFPGSLPTKNNKPLNNVATVTNNINKIIKLKINTVQRFIRLGKISNAKEAPCDTLLPQGT